MKKFYVSLLAAFLFIFESLFVNQLAGLFADGDKILAPRFLMLFLVFMAAYSNNRKALWYSFVLGLLFDIVYTEILGVYMAIFPVIIYLVGKLMKMLQNNIFVVSFISLVAVVMLECIIAGFHSLIGSVNMSISEFMSIRLLPTLLLNAGAVVLFAYPFKYVITKFGTDAEGDMLFRRGK